MKYKVRERLHDELLYHLLAVRGVTEKEAIDKFLLPDFAGDSHDPFLLPDMDVAVDRVLSALKNNEKVCVWSDYDCDGIPGGVMLTEFLRMLGLTVRHYIPHRHEEGYGLNNEGIDELAGEGVTVVITIDLGTTEHESIAHAKTKGIDVIVTDHHLVPTLETVSQKSSGLRPPDGQTFSQQFPALAFINPKRPDSKYPFDGLCGAGVAWKLVQALLIKDRPIGFAEGREKWFLDLVGLATLSDMVPLVGENRMLAHFGLRVIRKNRRPGLSALLSLLRIKPADVTEDDIGFMISPRINAASRMDTPHTASRLLGAQTKEEAEGLARELNHINDERKGLVASTVKEVNRRLGSVPIESSVIVMGNPNWRPGILGLVANTLVEAHGKPVFLWGREGGDVVRGSVRGDGVVNVVELMEKAGNIFNTHGGHHSSGGFSLEEGRVHELAAHLEKAYVALKAEAKEESQTLIDRELDLAEVSHAKSALTKLAPFGQGNEKPLFIFPSVSIYKTRSFGKSNDHLELELGGASDTRISGVSFFSNTDSFSKKATVGGRADIVGHVENDWRGRARIRVVDII